MNVYCCIKSYFANITINSKQESSIEKKYWQFEKIEKYYVNVLNYFA